MKNVIDMNARLAKGKLEKSAKKSSANKSSAPVIDMTEKRAEIISQERRQVKRTILSEFVGAMALIPGKGLLKVTLYDISENGLSFDVDTQAGHFSLGEDVMMRVYLNQQTYFPFMIKIQNIRAINDEGLYRHGAHFNKGNQSEDALRHFIRFVETVGASLQKDDGDLMASSIAR